MDADHNNAISNPSNNNMEPKSRTRSFLPTIPKLMKSRCKADQSAPQVSGFGGIPCPEQESNLLVKLFTYWLDPLIKVGFKRDLKLEDFWQLNERNQAKVLAAQVNDAWEHEVASKTKRGKQPSLITAVTRAFGPAIVQSAIFRLIADTCTVVSPLVVQNIIIYLQNGPATDSGAHGYILALILLLLQLLNSISNVHKDGLSQQFSSGKLVNIMSSDANRIDLMCFNIHLYWAGPYIVILAMSLLLYSIGPSALVGFGLLLLYIPFQSFCSTLLSKNRRSANLVADSRIRATQETLSGIRVIKMYSWENPYLKSIADLRFSETGFIRNILLVRASVSGMSQAMPVFATMLSFIVYVQTGNTLNPANIFTALGLFNVLRIPLIQLPLMLTQTVDGFAALRRIESVLLSPEMDCAPGLLTDPNYGLVVKSSSFSWEATDDDESEPDAAVTDGAESSSAAIEASGADPSTASSNIDSALDHKTVVVDYPVPLQEPSSPPGSDVSEKLLADGIVSKEQYNGIRELGASQTKLQTDSVPRRVCLSISADAGENRANDNLDGADANAFKLHDIDVAIEKGSLVAIIGTVGAGKSSFLNAIIGEMRKSSGTGVFVGGTISYCAQQPWIRNDTLRNNGNGEILDILLFDDCNGKIIYTTLLVLFGKPMDEKRYANVLRDCALERDLEILQGGDMAEIGERGINLSGGQKARVGLARAVYQDTDIVLMDDVLSAVDSGVGKSLFDNCILGALKGKTRILVTHALQYLPRVDKILVMSGGTIVEQGTYKELMADKYSYLSANQDAWNSPSPLSSAESVQRRRSSVKVIETEIATKKAAESPAGEKLMSTEEEHKGKITWSAYGTYLKMLGGFWVTFAVVLGLVMAQVTRIGTDQWLVQWTNKRFPLDTGSYEGIYVALGLSQCLFILGQSLVFAYAGANASRRIHNAALEKIFRSPATFFDTTPLGRQVYCSLQILNRFSKDVDTIDLQLPENFRTMLYTAALTIGNFVLICIIFPIMLAPLIPALIFYGFVQQYYTASSRALRRWDSITRSPLLAHYSEALTGLPTIRAYGIEDRFRKENLKLLDDNNAAYYLYVCIQRWLNIRLEFASSMIIFLTGIFCITERSVLSPASAGLVLSYALTITTSLNWAVRNISQTENNMNSIERLVHYCESLESEKPDIIPEHRPPASWPSEGKIEIRNLTLRYRDNLPDVIHEISFTVEAGQKLGVVGRTGAGKSSIVVALLRLVEKKSGEILIDNLDVSMMGLHDLRKSISTIPQEPVLFSGTIRSNLDPFDQYSDEAIWAALGQSDMKGVVANTPGALEAAVTENGENWSQGQRQLLCLARALLRKSKIVILDEASASVDGETDEFIRATIRRDFADSTIITIAHRLDTVVDYDKILVLSHGTVLELDTPHNLLSNPNSAFSKMVDETGKTNAQHLRDVAAAKHLNKS
ncbi:hypothetical protein SmJEL517_g00165 [Synchytrium microbalum]|uniref:Uncharacterized protein n=1 Tax=Synchytrium microbalum TaxID=1806994 RepID=A0A507CFJ3_9FUNG|nr:uncharacterized protein SmJEL517_g00165 [Synchytrium microbalum]TPX38128.1 hypothetical protein SmJEL517_g00165 [Synchytrium microbalum]